jgi:hypothetical protein
LPGGGHAAVFTRIVASHYVVATIDFDPDPDSDPDLD